MIRPPPNRTVMELPCPGSLLFVKPTLVGNAPATWLTELRTAAVSAVATRALRDDRRGW